MSELLGELLTPLRGLGVALAGVYLTYLWYHGQRGSAVLLGILACAVGLICDRIGTSLLPKRPRSAMVFLELWVLSPAALAAVAAAVVVLVTVALTVPDTTATATKDTLGALSTGLTAFITSAFISWAGDDKDSRVADHIRETFWSKYGRAGTARGSGVHYFRAESPGELWVFADEYRGIEGWGRSARWRRAQGIAQELKSRGSEP